MGIRTAILGYGRSGSSLHAGPIEKHDDFDMIAACDIDPARRDRAVERFGCTVYEDYHRMLDEEALDLVVIVTRSHQHCEMTCDCLAAGVNVLVTKPWAVNEAEARRMTDAAATSKGMLLPWLPARWGGDLARLRQLLDEGAIGNVFLVRRAVCSFATRCDWQTERRCGGGYLLNWGPHIVDPPVVLLGSPVRSVYGRMKQTINPGDTEDVFFAVMTLENGAIIQAEYTVAVESLPGWFIQGDRGTIVVRDGAIKVYKKTPAQPDDPTNYGSMRGTDEDVFEEAIEGSRYGDEFQIYAEVAQALRGERPYPVTPEDALELSRVLDAIRISSEEDRVVEL
ncbi:MAG: Gfo/Idh/MocA family oxidoreductase [Candidatus Hydrogenedentes bacterium]|nr:Gfo/Idh/MocA family oxidoreductase [Candidatus Hydrogenedentota bacterium]